MPERDEESVREDVKQTLKAIEESKIAQIEFSENVRENHTLRIVITRIIEAEVSYKRSSAINLLSLIIAVVGGAVTVAHDRDKIFQIISAAASLLLSILAPEAQAADIVTSSEASSELVTWIGPFLSIGIFLILLGCLYIVTFSNRTQRTVDRAWDMIKIIAGFFIGTLTQIAK